jgi:hypothetical protein
VVGIEKNDLKPGINVWIRSIFHPFDTVQLNSPHIPGILVPDVFKCLLADGQLLTVELNINLFIIFLFIDGLILPDPENFSFIIAGFPAEPEILAKNGERY